MTPQFTPRGGIGSTYKDPKTGEVYKFTAQGWVLQSGDIQKETIQKETFEVKPDEQELVERLKVGGSSQEQINQGLAERRRVLGNLGTDNQVVAENKKETSSPLSPFQGMTKREVLLDAFNKGVTSVSELEKIEKLYDKLVGEEITLTDIENFEMLAPEAQEKARENIKKIVIQKGLELGTGLEREGVLGAVGTFDTGQELIDMLESGISTGILPGLVRGGLSVFGANVIPGTRAVGKTTPEEDRLNSLMTVYTAQFVKAISGAQVSDKERQFLMNALPSESKTRQNNIAGIKAIEEFLSNRYSAFLGVNLNPLRSSEGKNDPMRIFSGKEESNPLGI